MKGKLYVERKSWQQQQQKHSCCEHPMREWRSSSASGHCGPLTPSQCTTINVFCSIVAALYSSGLLVTWSATAVWYRVAFLQKLIQFELFTAGRCIFFWHPLWSPPPQPKCTTPHSKEWEDWCFHCNAWFDVNEAYSKTSISLTWQSLLIS